MKKAFSLLLCISLISSLLIIMPHAASRVSLFIGDNVWENDSLAPFIETDGKNLVPLLCFASFDDTKVTISTKLGSALIERGDEFLSINLNFGSSLDHDGIIRDIEIYSYSDELYVNPTDICDRLGYSFEMAYAPDGFLCARIMNGEQQQDIKDLMALYVPNKTQLGSVYLRNISYKTVSGLFMYPILIKPSSASVQKVIANLGGHSATFAIDPSYIEDYASVLPLIYATGSSVSYYLDDIKTYTKDGIANFTNDMRDANDFLFALVGKTSKSYISSLLYKDIPAIDGYFKKSVRIHLLADDLASDRIVDMSLTESPSSQIYNFSLASDYDSRLLYNNFFSKFDSYINLRTRPVTITSAVQ